MNTVDSNGIATRIPAPTATNGRAPASRAIAQASGLGLMVFSTKGQTYRLDQLLRLAEIEGVVALKDAARRASSGRQP